MWQARGSRYGIRSIFEFFCPLVIGEKYVCSVDKGTVGVGHTDVYEHCQEDINEIRIAPRSPTSWVYITSEEAMAPTVVDIPLDRKSVV